MSFWRRGRVPRESAVDDASQTPQRPQTVPQQVFACIVIGAGQAGLSASYHLRRRNIDHVVLDANEHPGGAWQHRWKTLTMHDVHGIADLPDLSRETTSDTMPARDAVPEYFADYEQRFGLPVRRPVHVKHVREGDAGLLELSTSAGDFTARTLINATGTWSQPFIPFYLGADTFAGRQLHTVDYDGPAEFAGQRAIVVGGGLSAVQLLGELADIADTVWVTRREPVWRDGPFDEAAGRAAVALVEEQVRRGERPQSVVSVTGLMLREQEQRAFELGAYERRDMFARIEPDGVRWADGSFEPAEVILWATGFRPALGHLAPLHLRGKSGGITVDGTTVVEDPRIQLVGYGPSASTIGANRAGRAAARAVDRQINP